MSSVLWGLVAGLAAVGMEISYRKHWLSWEVWWMIPLIILPLALLVNYGVYKNIVGHGSFLQALVWFGLVTASGRIAAGFILLHEPMDFRNVAAAGALGFAALLRIVR